MGMIIGPTPWWQANLAAACPVGTTLPDGSSIFCKVGGRAWIMSPSYTQVGSCWTSGKYGDGVDAPGSAICCVCDWSIVFNQLITCGLNPSDWFVPNCSQMTSAYNCRSFWDCVSCCYVVSDEVSVNTVYNYCFGGNFVPLCSKFCTRCVRTIRCVTY